MHHQPKQGVFMEVEAAAPPIERLFLAVFPDMTAAERITALGWSLRETHTLQGKLQELSRLHVSLHCLGNYAGLRQSVVTAAIEAATAIAMPPFYVLFDRAGSFRGRPGNRPYVLMGGEGIVGLRVLHGLLGTTLQRVGLWRWFEPQYLPHITLLYDGHGVADHPVEPIGWTVREVVLVRSLHGHHRYECLARFGLSG